MRSKRARAGKRDGIQHLLRRNDCLGDDSDSADDGLPKSIELRHEKRPLSLDSSSMASTCQMEAEHHSPCVETSRTSIAIPFFGKKAHPALK